MILVYYSSDMMTALVILHSTCVGYSERENSDISTVISVIIW